MLRSEASMSVSLAVADGRLRAREQVGELLRELERAEAAHRVAGDHGPVGVERVAARDVGPHLEHVGAGVGCRRSRRARGPRGVITIEPAPRSPNCDWLRLPRYWL